MASEPLAARSVPETAGPSTDLQTMGAELRRVEFPTGVWGYERHAVDAYVARVGGFVDEAVTLRQPDGAVRDALARVGEETSAVLQRATEVAEDITARSQTQADDRVARAEREATAIKEAAEAQARELDAEIEHLWSERTRLLGEMERIAGELAALAKDADRRFPMPQAPEAVAGEATVEAHDDKDYDDYEDYEDEDFGLEEEGQADDDAVHHGEVPGSAELQITRVMPRVGGQAVPRD